jgi:hypothetical protein
MMSVQDISKIKFPDYSTYNNDNSIYRYCVFHNCTTEYKFPLAGF